MGRRKIEIKPLSTQRARKATFIKRKYGLFKKAYELGVLTGCNVAVIITDENGIAKHGYSSDSTRRKLDYENIPQQNMVGPGSFQKSVAVEKINIPMASPVAGSSTTAASVLATTRPAHTQEGQDVTVKINSSDPLELSTMCIAPGLLEAPNNSVFQDLVLYGRDIECLDMVPRGLDFSFANGEADSLSLFQPVFGGIQPSLSVPSGFNSGFQSFDEPLSASFGDIFIDIPALDVQLGTPSMWGETSTSNFRNFWPMN
jgi:MADS-box transcription factor